MYHFFKSDFFNFEFIRILGTIPFGGAEAAECLDAAASIISDDPESWYRAWLVQGERAEKLAYEAIEAGDRVAARDTLLRAANYFRASQYMFDDRPESPDSRVLPSFEKSVALFKQALRLIDANVKALEIPYLGKHTLPGYLYLPPQHKRLPGKIPILVNCGGADSTQEELYSLFPAAGVERGYAVLTFEGPGQGIVLRKDRLVMRPDWEIVTGHVLDHLFELSAAEPGLELDLSRIAIAGASMGGYYALRGASDPRFKACVSIDPIYDMWDLATDRMPPAFINAWVSGWLSDGFFNSVWGFLSKFAFQLKWEVTLCMWIFGKPSAALAMKEMRKWTLKKGEDKEFLSSVHCPVLVSGAAGTIYTRPEISTLRVAKALSHLPEDQREVWIATEVGQGGLQAKVGAWRLVQQRTFQFLDRHFGVKRPNLS
ncbi:dipeptidyl aminopeptidase/acylaminoacyl peptidase [Tothia fuscella]|uniref:Dipeptidyl aminopeptidase/acylaminoacyl peptidase n=1 Tax=Tothia fuscella TaxID=1048955 RepID=A0A9P4TZG2_9PEZI|nr:dipeptidyl aminopeptidase/acylaminoacyl peptidase [Tothia fuscella]